MLLVADELVFFPDPFTRVLMSSIIGNLEIEDKIKDFITNLMTPGGSAIGAQNTAVAFRTRDIKASFSERMIVLSLFR